MNFSDIPVPEIYKESADFRFFMKWFSECLAKLKYDTDNLVDLLDPERCPKNLLWLLADTMGFKYDSRLNTAFNRLVLIYFMSMIYNRGSKNGMTLAAEVNLAQFSLNAYAEEDAAFDDRLKDTSIPVNAVYVTPHADEGYIDLVYYSEKIPTDACIEYVRPLGMYCFTHAGVRVDSRTKISVDARLTNVNDMACPDGPTRVGHYRRSDYASLQKWIPSRFGLMIQEPRQGVYYRNKDSEKKTSEIIDPGYRSLYSLQLSNNEHIVKSLIPSGATSEDGKNPDPIFSLGYGPQDVKVDYSFGYLKDGTDRPEYNLRYDRTQDSYMTYGSDLTTIDEDRSTGVLNPRPAVNPIMSTVGDALSLDPHNTKYAPNPNKKKSNNLL